MKKLLTSALLISMSIGAEAALTVPGGLSVIRDWNFDGDGSPGGTVDSGASATDWTNNSWQSVRDDGNVSAIFSGLEDDTRFYVDTTYGSGSGALTYGHTSNSNRGFEIELGASMTSGFVDYNAFLTRDVAGGSGIFSSKVGFYSGNTLAFELNMRSENQLRHNDAAGDSKVNITSSGDLTGINGYQISWENNKFNVFFDDAANSGANEASALEIDSLVNTGITKIKFSSNASSGRVETTFDDLYIAGSVAVPEPSTLALAGLAGLTLLARRRR